MITYQLNEGEIYAGAIIGKEGQPDHHLILLPGESDSVNWNSAKEWASAAGGELPTRREQSLLYANLKEHFQGSWYWSGEQHAAYSDYAWGQYFGTGNQNCHYEAFECRARAVRRVAGGAGPRQAAIGNMGKLAGSSRWIGSLHWWKRMVKTHLSLQHIKRQVARWNKDA